MGENFSFHFKVPVATSCLSLGPDVSYVHDLKRFVFGTGTARIPSDSAGFRRPQRCELVIERCLWYLHLADGQLEKRRALSSGVFPAAKLCVSPPLVDVLGITPQIRRKQVLLLELARDS